MNTENFIKLRDYMEKAGPDKFDMGAWLLSTDNRTDVLDENPLCGTSGCIAGTAAIVMHNLDLPVDGVEIYAIGKEAQEVISFSNDSEDANALVESVRNWLDIDEQFSDDLFTPVFYGLDISMHDIEFGDALSMLDRFIEGSIDFDDANAVADAWEDIYKSTMQET